MFGYSHYIHSFKKESTHFGLRILTNFGWRYRNILYSIIKQGKLINSQFFIHNVLPKNVLIPPTHILPTPTKTIFTTSLQILLSTNFSSKRYFNFERFFWYSDKGQPHHLVRCHHSGINNLLDCFLNILRFKYVTSRHKRDMNNWCPWSSSTKFSNTWIPFDLLCHD